MKKYSANKHHTLNELNITPLLDLCFVLLVIFILTTAPPVNDIDITLPTGAANPKEPKKLPNYVEINSEGKIRLNNNVVNEQQLQDALIHLRKNDTNLSVIVRADSEIQVQRLVNVLDVLISANVAKFGLATDAKVGR